MYQLKAVPADDKDLVLLFQQLDNELSKFYPVESIHGVNLQEVGQDHYFLIVFVQDKAIACGAIRQHKERCAEIKRMFVQAQYRGRGISKIICRELEQKAISLGYDTMLLETGPHQKEAISLYKKSGYKLTAKFGEYINDPVSLCFRKFLK